MSEPTDRKQIGLTPEADEMLKEFVEQGLFSHETDGYKFAVSYAVGQGFDPSEAVSGGYRNKFNAAGGVDADRLLATLIEVSEVGEQGRPYATAEKLADMGVRDLHRRLEGHESLGDVLTECFPDET